MTPQKKLALIRMILWTGAAADALWAAALVWPPLYVFLTGRALEPPSLNLRLAMGIGASLMAGWTVLLAWAAQSPVERRGVLLITVAPVICGLILVSLFGVLHGGSAVWIPFKCSALAIAMLIGYRLAGTMAAGGGRQDRRR